MSAACVLDSSVVARWWLGAAQDESVAPSRVLLLALRDRRLEVHVADLLLAEVGNALCRATRLHAWPPVAAAQSVADLLALGLVVHETAPVLAEAFALATGHGVTVYDAVHVALCARLGLPLYTADARLARAVGGTVPLVRDVRVAA